MDDDRRRLPFGLLPPADPRTLHIPRGMNDVYGDGPGDALRPGQPGWESDLPVLSGGRVPFGSSGNPPMPQPDPRPGQHHGDRDEAMRGANMQALRMMIQRDPSLLWGKGDAMNPADRPSAQGQGATWDRMPNYAYPTSDGGKLPDTGMQQHQIPETGIPSYPKPDGQWVGVPTPDGPSHWSGYDL